MFIFILVFTLLYGGINYYIGLRGWQNVGCYIPFLNKWVYWIVFWVIALSYIAGRIGRSYLPGFIGNNLTLAGSFWMAAMLYFILILFLMDLVRLSDKYFRFLPESIKQNPKALPVTGLVILLLVILLLVYGSWNAANPRVRHYDITINKDGGSLKDIHVVMVSDIHLGNIIHNGRLTMMVDMINDLNPDIVLLAGDTIDEDVGPFVEQKMSDTFRKLNSRFGVYAVLGNHEYIGRNAKTAVKYLEEAGVRVLQDSFVRIADSFYIAGRDDLAGERFNKSPRKTLEQIMDGTDKALPVILIDHQPGALEEADCQGIDLQLSGHTHRGQMFPNQIITSRIYEVDWGYLKKENLQVIVSSGFGTWGPPIRIGNTPEIVDIKIHFKQERE